MPGPAGPKGERVSIDYMFVFCFYFYGNICLIEKFCTLDCLDTIGWKRRCWITRTNWASRHPCKSFIINAHQNRWDSSIFLNKSLPKSLPLFSCKCRLMSHDDGCKLAKKCLWSMVIWWEFQRFGPVIKGPRSEWSSEQVVHWWRHTSRDGCVRYRRWLCCSLLTGFSEFFTWMFLQNSCH